MGGPIPLSGPEPVTAGLGLSLEVMGMRASGAQAKQLHPGSASTLPNSSLFPPVPMATCDLTGFLGALPAFSAEIRPVTRLVLLSSLSVGGWHTWGSAQGCLCCRADVPHCRCHARCPSLWHLAVPALLAAETPGVQRAPGHSLPCTDSSCSQCPVFQILTFPSAQFSSFALLSRAHKARMEKRDQE